MQQQHRKFWMVYSYVIANCSLMTDRRDSSVGAAAAGGRLVVSDDRVSTIHIHRHFPIKNFFMLRMRSNIKLIIVMLLIKVTSCQKPKVNVLN